MVMIEEEFLTLSHITYPILHQLRFSVHRIGYKQLLILIPYYVLDDTQSLTKELYPRVAKEFGHSSYQAVEHAVRVAIVDAWQKRDSAVWEKYLPGLEKPPSNKQFIAAIAQWVKIPLPVKGEA